MKQQHTIWQVSLFLLMMGMYILSVHSVLAQPREIRIGELQLGLNNGIKNTEIFKHASRTQQGLSYAKYKWQESLFLTVLADSKKSPSQGQACRIVQFNFDKKGNVNLYPAVFTKVLPIGHGQGFGANIESGILYFYCQSHYDPNSKNNYLAISKVKWRGKDTNESDIQEIPLLHDSRAFKFLTPSISTDGKHLVVLANGSDKRYHCLIYDLPTLKPYATPLRTFPIETKFSKKRAWQGLCASDKYIYFIYGGAYSLEPHVLSVYDYQGRKVQEYLLENEKKLFGGTEGLLTYQHGTPWNIELEGIALRNKELYITGICTVSLDGDIVTWKGKNYVCLKTTQGTQNPSDRQYWMRTNKPATRDAYQDGVRYLSGKELQRAKKYFVARYKYLYKITGVPM